MYSHFLRIVLALVCAGLSAADTTFAPPLVPARPATFAVDPAGNQYIAGILPGTVDLNPGIGEVSRSSAGGSDVFIIRLNADGGFAWARSFGGSSGESAAGIALNGGFVYVTGQSSSTNAGFDGVAGVSVAGAFVLAFDANTGAVKANFDGDGIASYPQFSSVAGLASSGANLYLAGVEAATSDAAVAAINASTGALDLSFSTDGIQTFGGAASTETVTGIAADATRVYLAGSFSGTGANIGATGGTINSVGSDDGFVAAMNLSDGSAATGFSGDGVVTFGGTGQDRIQGISVSDGKVFVGGTLGSTDAGFGAAGTLSRVGTQADGFVIALDSSGSPVASFDGDGVLLLANPGDGGVLLTLVSAEFGAGVTTPGVAIQTTFRTTTGVPTQVAVADFDGTGAKRTAFGIGGEISFDGSSTDIGAGVVRGNGRTTFGAYGNASSDPVIKTTNLIPRGLGGDANCVASFSSDLGAPLFAHFADIFPRADDVAGGRTVSVFGGGFGAGMSIKVGGADMTGISVAGPNKAMATVPPGTAGDKVVTVTLANGRQLSTNNAFAYGNKDQATGPVFRGPAKSATADADGNLYFVGTFVLTVDFDPSAGVDMQRSTFNASTAFVTRMNADGSYGWTSLLVGLGGTNLNAVAVKGERVFAVGDISPDQLTSVKACNAGINGLGNATALGQTDGVIMVLDRATGAAVNSVSSDGIITVGGSTDTVFGQSDTLHSISASPTANTLAVAGRMVSTNVGVNGLGAINANDGAGLRAINVNPGANFLSFDTDGSLLQTVLKDYTFTPPASNVVSAIVQHSPDGANLITAVMSGDQVDLSRFIANLSTPDNSFGVGGTKSFNYGELLARMSLDVSSTGIIVGVTKSGGSGASVVTLDSASGNAAPPLIFTPAPDQTPPRFIEGVSVVLLDDDAIIGIETTGDIRFDVVDNNTTKICTAQCVDQFDTNVLFFYLNLGKPLELADSKKICKSDDGDRETLSTLVKAAEKVIAVGATDSDSTVRFDTQEVTPLNLKGFVFSVEGFDLPGYPPYFDDPAPSTIILTQGVEHFVTIVAHGSETILLSIEEPKTVPPFHTISLSGNILRVKTLTTTAFPVVIKAKNDYGSALCTYNFKVNPNPKAPRILLDETTTYIAFKGHDNTLFFYVLGDEPIVVTTTNGTAQYNYPGPVSGLTRLNLEVSELGTKTVTVGATNEFGADSKTVNILVLDPNGDSDGDSIPDGEDQDLDHVPDRVESGLSANPKDPGDVPSGISPYKQSATPKTKSTTVVLDHRNPDLPTESILDQIEFGKFDLGNLTSGSRAAPKPAAGTLIYEFGGFLRIFNIDANGKAVSGSDKATLKLKLSKGVPSGNLSVSIKNANLKAALADEGLTNIDAKKLPVTVKSFIAFHGVIINRTVNLEYTSKLGKKGTAKLKKK